MNHEPTLLYFYLTDRTRDVIAKAHYPRLDDPKTPDTKFYVLKGAFLLKKATFDHLRDLAKRHEIEAKFVADAGHYWILTEDIAFNSPAHAASIILGKDVSGEALWFDGDDVALEAKMK